MTSDLLCLLFPRWKCCSYSEPIAFQVREASIRIMKGEEQLFQDNVLQDDESRGKRLQ